MNKMGKTRMPVVTDVACKPRQTSFSLKKRDENKISKWVRKTTSYPSFESLKTEVYCEKPRIFL